MTSCEQWCSTSRAAAKRSVTRVPLLTEVTRRSLQTRWWAQNSFRISTRKTPLSGTMCDNDGYLMMLWNYDGVIFRRSGLRLSSKFTTRSFPGFKNNIKHSSQWRIARKGHVPKLPSCPQTNSLEIFWLHLRLMYPRMSECHNWGYKPKNFLLASLAALFCTPIFHSSGTVSDCDG